MVAQNTAFNAELKQRDEAIIERDETILILRKDLENVKVTMEKQQAAYLNEKLDLIQDLSQKN